jgi:hypothetical protein
VQITRSVNSSNLLESAASTQPQLLQSGETEYVCGCLQSPCPCWQRKPIFGLCDQRVAAWCTQAVCQLQRPGNNNAGCGFEVTSFAGCRARQSASWAMSPVLPANSGATRQQGPSAPVNAAVLVPVVALWVHSCGCGVVLAGCWKPVGAKDPAPTWPPAAWPQQVCSPRFTQRL